MARRIHSGWREQANQFRMPAPKSSLLFSRRPALDLDLGCVMYMKPQEATDKVIVFERAMIFLVGSFEQRPLI